MRISDWSSDVCSSDLRVDERVAVVEVAGCAGAERLVAIGIGDRRRARVAVDALDQGGAGLCVKYMRQHELKQIPRWLAADAGDCGPPPGGAVGCRGRHGY